MPKYLNKKKKINLYKAFILNPGERMDIKEDADIFGLSYEAAVQFMLYSTDKSIDLKDKEIAFVIFTIERSYLDTHDLIDEGEVYYKDDNISITLKDKPYKMDVESKIVDEIDVEINDKTEVKTIKSIKFKE
jgi:hypothetical protein